MGRTVNLIRRAPKLVHAERTQDGSERGREWRLGDSTWRYAARCANGILRVTSRTLECPPTVAASSVRADATGASCDPVRDRPSPESGCQPLLLAVELCWLLRQRAVMCGTCVARPCERCGCLGKAPAVAPCCSLVFAFASLAPLLECARLMQRPTGRRDGRDPSSLRSATHQPPRALCLERLASRSRLTSYPCSFE